MPSFFETLSNARDYLADRRGLRSTPGSRNTNRLNAVVGFMGSSFQSLDQRVIIPESFVQSITSLYALFRRDPTLAERFAHFLMFGVSVSRLTLSSLLFFNHDQCSDGNMETNSLCDGLEYTTLFYAVGLGVVTLASEMSKQPFIPDEDDESPQLSP